MTDRKLLRQEAGGLKLHADLSALASYHCNDMVVDSRGRGDKALDQYGEVSTPQAMAELAWKFHQQYGYRVHKLKAGVLRPESTAACALALESPLPPHPASVSSVAAIASREIPAASLKFARRPISICQQTTIP